MEIRENMDSGDVPAEQILPSRLNPNLCPVLAALPFTQPSFPHSPYSRRSCSRGQSPGMGKLRVLGEDPKRSHLQGQSTERLVLWVRRASL